jgi:hypothetical protein
MTIPTGSTAITDPNDPTKQASVDGTGALKVSATFSASSVAINDGTTPTNKLAIDGNGKIGISSMPSVTASNPSVGTSGSAIPTSSTLIGASDGTNLQAAKVDGSGNLKTVDANTSTIATNTGNTATGVGGVADSAYSSGSGSIISVLKGIFARLALGQQTKSASLPVTLASDQGNVAISGTVTANAGTNLNTSLLALESGGNLATLAGAVSSAKVQANTAQINGVAPSMGNGVSGTGVQRVTIASDSTGQVTLAAGSAVVGSTTIQATSGTALAADQSNTELRTSIYGKNSAAGDTAVAVDSSGRPKVDIDTITASLSQSNQIPVSNAAPQGKLTITGSLSANSDNSLTFSGGATVARRIRIQNESSGVIYWETDATASAGSPSLAAPAANAVSAEWISVQCTTLHIFIPSGGTTTLNGSGGVKVTAYA